jgi:hypothetical protein
LLSRWRITNQPVLNSTLSNSPDTLLSESSKCLTHLINWMGGVLLSTAYR